MDILSSNQRPPLDGPSGQCLSIETIATEGSATVVQWLLFKKSDQRVFWAPVLAAGGRLVRFPSIWLMRRAEDGASSATLDKRARAFQRFSDYYNAFPPAVLPATATDVEVQQDTERFHQNFIDKLNVGSTELGWKHMRQSTARDYGRYIAEFCDWLVLLPGFEHSAHPAPLIETSKSEHWTVVQQRMERDMLSHLYRATKAGRGIRIERKNAKRKSRHSLGDQLARSRKNGSLAHPDTRQGFQPKAMPRDDYEKLLASTYAEKNWRNLCLWLLLGAGCNRSSESLNIFVSDIYYNPADQEAYVALSNPVEGLVQTPDGKWIQRREYLRQRFGTLPRCLLAENDALYAGYKGMMLAGSIDAQVPEIEFWPQRGWALVEWLFPSYGRLFAQAHQNYCGQLRQLGVNAYAKHPYLFLNIGRNRGAPMTRQNLIQQLQNDCKRAGIRKREPHSLRHMYGAACADLKIPLTETQVRMRHRSPESTLEYYNMSRGKARKLLAQADQSTFSQRRERMLQFEMTSSLRLF